MIVAPVPLLSKPNDGGAVVQALDDHLAIALELPTGSAAERELQRAVALRRRRATGLVALDLAARTLTVAGIAAGALVSVVGAVHALGG